MNISRSAFRASVLFASFSALLHADSLTVEGDLNTTGNIGVGTSTPSAKLDVVGDARISGVSGAGDSLIFASEDGVLKKAGKIDIVAPNGLGQTEQLLRIYNNLLVFGNQNGTSSLQFGRDGAAMGYYVRYTDAFAAGEGYSIAIGSAGVDRFLITQAGNVGINTATPAEKLDVAGNVKISGSLTVGGHAVVTSNQIAEFVTPDLLTGFLAIDGSGASLTGLTKAQVGLDNVDNTSDADKPVSTAQLAALTTKVAIATTITAGTGLTGGGDLSTNRTLALSTTAQASLGKADTALQPTGDGSQLTGITATQVGALGTDSGAITTDGNGVITAAGLTTTNLSATTITVGTLVMTAPAGDISMGIYGNP